ncbi:MAG: putative lipoprotein [uncultured Nocardioidaceae bacterium]|uniref:Putative lipoprotein n=1 Tax=uncultured Nocardioidaceae bacterium TaxID=253824 RepID=A0A6J4N563_9ACTN|nr:MAG: putative lipoprotein [uncultured Nocardioidaceae bacterium]
MKTSRAAAATAMLLAVTALAGCGSSDDDAPALRTAAAQKQTTERKLDQIVRPMRLERPVVIKSLPEPVEEPEPELVPGPTLYGPGDEGPEVRKIQARLRQIEWFYGDVTDFYGDQTEEAVAGFQEKRGFPVTGAVDQRTLDRLVEMSYEPTADELNNVEPEPVVVDAADGAPLDPRCLTGRVLCVDKSSSSLRWVVDGEVQMSLDARFGGNGYFTREGQFSVFSKSRDHVSSLYETSMPFAMFFSGGQAVHYSPDFAATGYNGASHGCVNIRDYDAIASLYDQVQIGDGVVVYWS